MSKDLKKTLNFNCSPKEFFNLITNSPAHAKLTGKPANVSKKVGAKFRSYGTMIEGMNVDVKDNKEITQAWRAKDWPKGVYSIVQYKITKNGTNKTKVVFTQTGVPPKFHNKMKEGWQEHYWNKIKTHLKETAKETRKKAA